MSSFKLLNDLAVDEEKNSRTDGLGFQTYARVLGNAALGTEGPFTIGIFGEWGTGKTSLMHLMQSYLNTDKNVITVWFNAWRYEKEEHPIVPLLATIIRELQLNRTFTQSLNNQGREFLNALRAVAYGFSAKSTIKVPGLAEIEASFVAKEMVERAESLSNDPLLGRSLYYEAFERLSAINIGGKKKIVVFVDDLDRCFPDLAIKLLESIKLVLSQAGFVFVIGVARTVIEGYLQHRYQKEYGLENFEGEFYLDKIVQLPFHIPPHHERVNQFCDSLLKQLDPADTNVFASILPTIANTTGGNPRATIRFVNNLLIDRAINHSLAETDEMESIPIEYFAVTRILQQQWFNIFSIIITSPEIAQEVSSWSKEQLSQYSQSENKDRSFLATRLLSDRLLSDLLLSTYGQSWLKDENIRNSTIGFLKHRTQEAEAYREHQERKYDIFISYQRKDKEHVDKIASALTQSNISVFYDMTSLLPGMDWEVEIKSALTNSKGVLFCFGKDTMKFGYVQKEIKVALDYVEKSPKDFRLIPILLPGADIETLPLEIKTYQWLDMRDGVSLEKTMQIVRALSKW
ncbi:MAG: TIR domain-containing protein [Anaerolineales bacterium]|uniref:P-loop NTPase fold protein n=1 Tax=Candidatus Villigracilis vicinus TaxID=3140679 RepID=UPI0031350415|nr:TIR domain-containing protein [Anaerolineales bacterium]